MFILLASGEILLSLSIPLPVMLHIGLLGAAAYIVPIIMVLCGLLLWFNPAQRMFYSILAVVMSLLTWITSNLGGFFFGILLGLIGGSLAFAWAPGGLRSRRARRKVASTPGDTSDRA